MKNCNCKLTLPEVHCECDHPVIKLIVDECTGCDLYPVTSTEAVKTGCGSNLELELANILNLIKTVSDKLNDGVLDETNVNSLKFAINALLLDLNDISELRNKVDGLENAIESLECLANIVDKLDLNIGNLKSDFNDYIVKMKHNEDILTDLYNHLPNESDIEIGITEDEANTLITNKLNNYATKAYVDSKISNSGSNSGSGTSTSIVINQNGRKVTNNNIVGNSTYAIHTNYESIVYKVENTWVQSPMTKCGGNSYGGWITNNALFKAIDECIVSVNISGNVYKGNSTSHNYVNKTDNTDIKTIEEVKQFLNDSFATVYNKTSGDWAPALSSDTYVESNIETYLWHFSCTDDPLIALTSTQSSCIKLPHDYELCYDISHQKLGYVRHGMFINPEGNFTLKRFNLLADEPVSNRLTNIGEGDGEEDYTSLFPEIYDNEKDIIDLSLAIDSEFDM